MFVFTMTCLLVILGGAIAYVAYDAWNEWRFQRTYARFRTRQAAARIAFFERDNVDGDGMGRELTP